METKKWAPMAIALVLGLIAAKLLVNVMSHHTPAPADAQHTLQMVVLKHPVGPGQKLVLDDVGVAAVAGDSVPEEAFTNPGDVVGRVTLTSMFKGQAVVKPLLAAVGSASGLEVLIPKGMRAITLEITEVAGVGGFIQPGCHVDILETLHDANNNAVTEPVVQNITVTAVGHRLNPTPAEGEGPATPVPHITLLVTPEQAERIQLAATSGRPYLVLRAAGDNDPMSTTGITVANLRGDDSDAPLGAQLLARSMFQPTTRPGDLGSSTQPSLASATTQPDDDLHVRTVTLIQGGAVSTVTFQMPDDKGAAGQVSGINAEMKPIN